MFCRVSMIFLSLVCLGCAYLSPSQSNPKSFDGVSALYPDVTRQLADDAAQRLGSAFSPQTRFSVNTGTEFGRALDEALRSRGFLMASSGTQVRYSVDTLAGTSSIYVHLSLPDGASINQMYSLSEGGLAVPSGNIVKTGLPDSVNLLSSSDSGENGAAGSAYSLEAWPDRLQVGKPAEVVFTLRKNGQPVAGGLKPYFEAHPSFPNLRTGPRNLDKNGTFRIKGLKPEQAGQAQLRLVLDKDSHVETVISVADNAPAAAPHPAPAIQNLANPPLVPEIKPMPVVPAGALSPPVLPAQETLPSLASGPVQVTAEWTIVPGLLRGQLEDWAARAGYQLVWKARYDFEMQSQIIFREDFVGSVKRLFQRMHAHGNLLRVTIYEVNKVLEVTED